MFVLTLTDQHENQMEYPLGSWKCKKNTQRSELENKNLETMHIEAVIENDKGRYIKNRKKSRNKTQEQPIHTCVYLHI